MTETSAERRAALVAGLIAAPLALLTILVVTRFGPLMSLDRSVTRWLHDGAEGTGWMSAFRAVTVMGQPRVAEGVLALVAVGFAVRRQWWTSCWLISALAVTALGWSLAKVIIQRPRPDIPDQISGWSYPSGHAAEIACAATLLVILTWRQLRPGVLRGVVVSVWVAIAFLVGLSRLVLGAHYPSDVVAGWLLGILVAYLLAAVFGIVNPAPPAAVERPLSSMPEHLRTLAVVVNPVKLDADAFRVRVSRAARAAGWDEPMWFETTIDDSGGSMARRRSPPEPTSSWPPVATAPSASYAVRWRAPASRLG